MENQIEVRRIFDAPVEMVWKIWTEPELVKRWWGPKHFTSPVAKLDFREGGTSLVSMLAPSEMGGKEFYSIWVYKRIEHLQSIEFVQSLSDQNGVKIEPESVGMPSDFPRDIRTVVTLKQISKTKTEMVITEYGEFGSISNFAKLGLEQSVEKIAAILS